MSCQGTLLCGVMLVMILGQTCNAVASTKEDKRTSCKAAESKSDGKATVTCNFGQDISLTKHNVDVQFYPLSTNEPVSMLSCIWLARDPDKPKCFTHTGCSLLNELSDTLSLELNNTAMDLRGRYVCQLVPDDGIPVQPCTLLENDGLSDQEDQGYEKNKTVTSSYDLKRPGEPPTQPSVLTVPLGILAGVSIVLNIVLVAFMCLWWQRRNSPGFHTTGKSTAEFGQASVTSSQESTNVEVEPILTEEQQCTCEMHGCENYCVTGYAPGNVAA